jgi:GAF domain-containing protein
MTSQMRVFIDSLELQVEARTAQLEASADVGRAVASILDPDQLLRQVVNLITDRFGFYYAAVFTLDEAGKWAVLHAATGEAGRELLNRGHRLEVGGRSMVGYVTAQRKPRVALDVGEEAVRFNNPLLPNTRSEIALPLAVGERVLGALDVQSVQEAAFDDTSAAVLQSMADQVAIALNNAAQYSESQTNVTALNNLLEMSRDIAGSRTLDDLRVRALKHIQNITGIDNYYVALVDESYSEIRFILNVRPGVQLDEVIRRPYGSGRTEYVIQTRRTLRMTAAEAPLRLAQLGLKTWEETLGAFLGVPIIVGDRVLGMIGLQNLEADSAFNDLQERLTMALANQMGATLENLRLVDETQRALADLDAANRRLTSEAWVRYMAMAGAISGEWRSGEWQRLAPNAAGSTEPQADASQVMKLPVRVRGQKVGEFSLARAAEGQEWTPEEIAFAQSLIDQVGQAIELARLLEETERLAGRDRLINTITSRVRQTVSMDTILKTAVSELGRSLGAARVFARIGGIGEGGAEAGEDNGEDDDHA